LLAGFGMPAVVPVALYRAGAIALSRSGESVGAIAATVLTAVILTPVIEETVARYLLLRMVERLAGSWVAVGVTAVLFGAGHVAVAATNDALPGALLYAVPGTLAGVGDGLVSIEPSAGRGFRGMWVVHTSRTHDDGSSSSPLWRWP
jgi:membrane protease YdiL (CAAX protease family)